MGYRKMMGFGKKKTIKEQPKSKPKKNKIIEGIIAEQEQFMGIRTMKDDPPFKTPKQIQKEADLGDINLPAGVKRFMGKFVDGIKASNLNRMKRAAVLHHILTALGIKPNELSQYMSKVKRGLK